MSDPDPVEADGEVVAWRCPECGTRRFTEAKAIDCCADPSDHTGNEPATAGSSDDKPPGKSVEDGFADADFTDPETGIYSTNHTEREQWMGGAGDGGKQPFSPWSDRDHPEADPD
jgi:hypothetical protein